MNSGGNFIRLFFLLLITAFSAGASGDNPIFKEIDVTNPSEFYPYELREIQPIPKHGDDFGEYRTVDFLGDSLDEYCAAYSNHTGGGHYRSALILFGGSSAIEALWEKNQEFSGGLLIDIHCLDMVGSDKEDICLIRQLDTNIYLDIFSAGDSDRVNYNRVPAAIIEKWARDSGWYSLTVNPMTGIDLNGDGYRDLIFSRSSRVNGNFKRDSAFTRGMIAWDIHGDSLLWFLPLPDEVGSTSFHTVYTPDGEPFFIFTKATNNNPYVASDMHSGEGYIMAVDINGRFLWRRMIGRGFYNGNMAMINDPKYEKPRLYIYISGLLADRNGAGTLNEIDPWTGELIPPTIVLPVENPNNLGTVFDPNRGEHILLVNYRTSSGSFIYEIYDADLNCLMRVGSELMGPNSFCDLTGDDRPEILAGSGQRRWVLLDLDMKVLAVSSFVAGASFNCPCKLPGKITFIQRNNNDTFSMIGAFPRNPYEVFFARYKWWLAVALALAFFIVLYRFIIWISRLYRSAAGLPSLDKINTAVIVMNRKGRILFANKTRLNAALLGGNKANGGAFSETPLGQNPAAGEILRKYAADPFVPFQGRLEYDIDDSRRQVELSVFPRTDENLKNIIGSIIVVEDISEKAAWNRKVVMGEAAQKWVHRLKGNMATAKIILENMNEDPRLAEFVNNSPVCRNYLNSLKDRIIETAQHSEKILRFVRITHPEPVPTDLNQLVERVTGDYQKTTNGKIIVAKEPQPGLPLIMVDPDQMVEVLDNLLSNAIDSLREEGRITIITRTADHLHNKSGGDNVEIIVRDNGRGISPEDIEKIFTPGFTKSGRGTGLGLAIVKEIVQNHGGKIEVTSEIDKGTKFTISLPANFQE